MYFKKNYVPFFLLILFQFLIKLNIAEDDCKRPETLIAKEAYCWKNNVELLDRIHETSQSILKFAVKKLKIPNVDVDEKIPVKCQYHVCIMEQFCMLSINSYPVYDMIQSWIDENVPVNQAKLLKEQVDLCNDALVKSEERKSSFNGEIGNKNYTLTQEMDKDANSTQTECEMISQFIKCLSYQDGCPVFVYPY